jgi:uncharacterized protein (TIGR02594 family)
MNHIELAFTQYGVKEIVGEIDNPEIIKYFDILGFDGSKLKDETAWCSAFANWVCLSSGLDCSGKLNARSWVDVGLATSEPKLGDIVIFWRESRESWKGHVAFYVNDDDKYIYVLGGNQGNQVKVGAYPKERLLMYRRVI